MTEAIFGLLGVIVGGVLHGVSAWVIERRRSEWAARRAGRLFTPALARCDFILTVAHEHGTSWGMVGLELRHALDAWAEHAPAFAATLRQDDWKKLLQPMVQFERIEQRANAGPREEIDADNREFLGSVAALAFDAMLTSGLVGMLGSRPPRARRLLRRLRHPFKREDIDADTDEFMRWYREHFHPEEPDS